MKLYVDGNLETLTIFDNDLGANTILNNVPLTMGSRNAGGVPTKGIIDEVEIYNCALSAQEIQSIFNAGAAGKCKVPFEFTEIKDFIVELPNTDFKNSNGNMAKALINKIEAVISTVEAAQVKTDPVLQDELLQEAIDKLQNDIRKKTDGCSTSGPPTPDNNDWIINVQPKLY